MGPTYLCKGIIIVGLILVWFAIFFNSAIAIISAFAVLLVVQWRLFSFQQSTKQVLAGIVCHRAVPAKYIRVGSSVEVRLSVLISVPGGFQAVVKELVSPTMVIRKGDLEYCVTGDRTEQVELAYTATPMVHGTRSFPGLFVRLSDRFFHDELNLQNDHFNGPVLKVYPTGSYKLGVEPYEYGEEEIERIRNLSGLQISGIREYEPGEDTKNIDWKMTAKYDKPMVREYMGLGGTSPLIILDLPEQVENAVPIDFHSMVQSVSGAVREAWKKYRKTSLVLISGPNILTASGHGGGIEQAISVLYTSAFPFKRPQTYYRFQTKGALRSLNGEISRMVGVARDNQDTHDYLAKIGSIVSSSQKDPSGVPPFHGEISRLLRMWPHETVIIFTLYIGDMSHIRFLIEQVHHDHGTVQLHVPADSGVPDFMRLCMLSGADKVKVF